MCIYPNIKHRLYSVNASIIPLYIHSAAVFCPIRQPTTTFHFTSSPPLLLSLSHSPLLLSVSSGNHHWPSLAAYELIGEILLNTTDKKLPKKEKEKKKSDATVPLSFCDLTLTTFNQRCLLARHWGKLFVSLLFFFFLSFLLFTLPDPIDTFHRPLLYSRGPMRTP